MSGYSLRERLCRRANARKPAHSGHSICVARRVAVKTSATSTRKSIGCTAMTVGAVRAKRSSVNRFAGSYHSAGRCCHTRSSFAVNRARRRYFMVMVSSSLSRGSNTAISAAARCMTSSSGIFGRCAGCQVRLKNNCDFNLLCGTVVELGDSTPGLLIANEALSQLSYSPVPLCAAPDVSGVGRRRARNMRSGPGEVKRRQVQGSRKGGGKTLCARIR